MLVLVSGATGFPRNEQVGHLIVPRKFNDPKKLGLTARRWAMDNGGYLGFDPGAFMRMLYAHREYPGCLFVAVPDVVGDAASTLLQWDFWRRAVSRSGAGRDVRALVGC